MVLDEMDRVFKRMINTVTILGYNKNFIYTCGIYTSDQKTSTKNDQKEETTPMGENYNNG